MTEITKTALTSDLLLLLLTRKGERYYEPDYGTNLLKLVFEQNDNITASDIEEELKTTVKNYMPNVNIDKVDFIYTTDGSGVRIDDEILNVNVAFTFSEDAFSEQGNLTISF
jgi:phage baseplate assembly protein W